MRHPRLVIAGLIMSSSALTACVLLPYSHTFRDDQKDQPWVAPGIQAKPRVRVKGDFVRLDQRLAWIAPDGREFDADALVARCESFLSANGFTREPTGEDAEGTPMPAERIGELGQMLDAPIKVYPNSPVIVCVDPLIVLVCDKPKQVPREDEFPGDMDKEGEWFVTSVRHTLPDGYERGTHGQCSTNLCWFSPDLDIAPQPLDFASGVETIATSWGILEITREGDQWTAVARPTTDEQGPPE